MKTFKESAIEILKKAGTPLHYKEITRLALEAGMLDPKGTAQASSLKAQITRDMKNNAQNPDFIQIASATFALNPHKKVIKATPKKATPNIVKAEQKIVEKKAVEKNDVACGLTGKGGEHAVCSELLFRGFDASIMSGVDLGVDISAIKGNHFFGIQVKSSQKDRNGIYKFNIGKKSFDKFNQGNIFYILVLRGDKKINFIVLPLNEIEKKITENVILTVKKDNNTDYALSVKIRDGKIYLGNKNHSMGYFLDNWDLIK